MTYKIKDGCQSKENNIIANLKTHQIRGCQLFLLCPLFFDMNSFSHVKEKHECRFVVDAKKMCVKV